MTFSRALDRAWFQVVLEDVFGPAGKAISQGNQQIASDITLWPLVILRQGIELLGDARNTNSSSSSPCRQAGQKRCRGRGLAEDFQHFGMKPWAVGPETAFNMPSTLGSAFCSASLASAGPHTHRIEPG